MASSPGLGGGVVAEDEAAAGSLETADGSSAAARSELALRKRSRSRAEPAYVLVL